MSIINNMPNRVSMIIEGIEKNIKVASNYSVSAGEFVEYVKTAINFPTQSAPIHTNWTRIVDVILLESYKVFVAYYTHTADFSDNLSNRVSYAVRILSFNDTNKTITYGTAYTLQTFTDYSTTNSLYQVPGTTNQVWYNISSRGDQLAPQSFYLKITGTTISTIAKYKKAAYAYSTHATIPVSSTKALYIYDTGHDYDDTYYAVLTFSESSSTVTEGTFTTISTSRSYNPNHAIAFGGKYVCLGYGTGSYHYAYMFTISGTTATQTDIEATSARYTTYYYLGEDETYTYCLQRYQYDNSSTYYHNIQQYVTATGAKVDGTAISVTEAYDIWRPISINNYIFANRDCFARNGLTLTYVGTTSLSSPVAVETVVDNETPIIHFASYTDSTASYTSVIPQGRRIDENNNVVSTYINTTVKPTTSANVNGVAKTSGSSGSDIVIYVPEGVSA